MGENVLQVPDTGTPVLDNSTICAFQYCDLIDNTSML